jgi:hypothetical protein
MWDGRVWQCCYPSRCAEAGLDKGHTVTHQHAAHSLVSQVAADLEMLF